MTATRDTQALNEKLVLSFMRQNPGAWTANEITDHFKGKVELDHEIRNCVYSMGSAGKLVSTGRRVCRITGNNAQAYAIPAVPQGPRSKKVPNTRRQGLLEALDLVTRAKDAYPEAGLCCDAVLEALEALL